MDFVLKKLDKDNIDTIKNFFADVFTNEPWNDDWSDEKQLEAYIIDLIGNVNSLTLGYFLNTEMVGLSMGYTKHWYTGTEYCIEEFCVGRNKQGMGIGTHFIKDVEQYLLSKDMKHIFLQTERDVPAYEFYKKNEFAELTSHVSFAKSVTD